MKTYELSYIVSPEITSEEAEAKGKEIESLIQGKEGTVLKQSNPIAKTLSYKIGTRASGFFGILEFQLEPEKLLELKEFVVKDKKIIRHMLVVKQAAEMKKERRTRTKPVAAPLEAEQKIEVEPVKEEEPASTEEISTESGKTHSKEKEKVELKDIEQKLDELLGE
jgi:ribosomal protein S6